MATRFCMEVVDTSSGKPVPLTLGVSDVEVHQVGVTPASLKTLKRAVLAVRVMVDGDKTYVDTSTVVFVSPSIEKVDNNALVCSIGCKGGKPTPGTAFLMRKDGKSASGGNPNLLQGLLALKESSSEDETAKAVAGLMTRKVALRWAPPSAMKGVLPEKAGYLVLRHAGKPLTLKTIVENLDTSAGLADGETPPVPSIDKCLECMRPVHEALQALRENSSFVDEPVDHAAHHAAMAGGEGLGAQILKALAEKKVALIGDMWASTVREYLMAFVEAQRDAFKTRSKAVAEAFDRKMQSLTNL